MIRPSNGGLCIFFNFFVERSAIAGEVREDDRASPQELLEAWKLDTAHLSE